LPTRAVGTTVTAVKDRLVTGAVLAVLIAFAVFWFNCRGTDKRTSASRPETTATDGANGSSASDRSEPATAGTPDARTVVPARAAHTAAERAAMLQAIETARSRRIAGASAPSSSTGSSTGSADSSATTLNITDNTGDTSAWEKRALGTLNTVLGECYDLGRAEAPKLEGTIKLRFTLAGEPGVGGVLERVEIVDDGTSITQQTIRDCMTQQLYALELDPPPEGMRVEREVTLKFP